MLADGSRSLVMTNVIWGRPGMNTSGHQLKVGLFGIGLDTYWPQFPGLQDRLIGYTEQVALNLANSQVRVINLGLIDTPEKPLVAGQEFRRAGVDLIFLYVTRYALSATVLPAVRRAKVPVIILNLAPAAAIDYDRFNHMGDRAQMTGEWLPPSPPRPAPGVRDG